MLKKLVLFASLAGLAAPAWAQDHDLPQPAVATAQAAGCTPTLAIQGEPKFGNTIQVCLGSTGECFGCVVVSQTPGTTPLGPYTIPVGSPIVGEVPVGRIPGALGGHTLCLPVTLNDPALIGQTFYLVFIATDGVGVEFSLPVEITITS